MRDRFHFGQRFGRSASVIIAENKLTDPDHLSPGQWLIIPALASEPEASFSIPLPPPATDSEFAALKAAAKQRPTQQRAKQPPKKAAVKAQQGTFDLDKPDAAKPAAKAKPTPPSQPGKAQPGKAQPPQPVADRP